MRLHSSVKYTRTNDSWARDLGRPTSVRESEWELANQADSASLDILSAAATELLQNPITARNLSDAESLPNLINAPPQYGSSCPSAEDDRKYKLGLRAFLAVSVTSAFLTLALEAFMFGVINVHRLKFLDQSRYSEVSIYLALFIFAAIYQTVVTVLGLRSKNLILLCMLCLFYACMVVYTGIQYSEISKDIDLGRTTWNVAAKATNISTIGVLGLTFTLQLAIIVLILGKSVRWARFKKIGASHEILALYERFQIHRAVLIFDFFFFLGFTVQFIVIMVSDKTSVEFILTCCMLPLTLVVLWCSDFAATRDALWLSCCTLLCFVGGCVYVLFKMIRLYTKYTSAYRVTVVRGAYFPGRTSLVTFGVITLIFLFATIALEVLVMVGYGRGLMPYVNEKARNQSTEMLVID